MEILQFVVDAFTDRQFGGNPAAVCILSDSIPGELMQNIAFENALPETAFIISNGNDTYTIRWFTPQIEMDLCGHATLASTHVIWNHLNYSDERIQFNSNSGSLEIRRKKDVVEMNFPARVPTSAALPETIKSSLNIQPAEVLKSRDYVLVYEDEQQIKQLAPDEQLLSAINLDPGGIAVTARGEYADFVSRYFTPQAQIFEDPVTGTAHCSLIPYWSERLGKKKMTAFQLSQRGGTLYCEDLISRVLISSKAKTFLMGTVYLDV